VPTADSELFHIKESNDFCARWLFMSGHARPWGALPLPPGVVGARGGGSTRGHLLQRGRLPYFVPCFPFPCPPFFSFVNVDIRLCCGSLGLVRLCWPSPSSFSFQGICATPGAFLAGGVRRRRPGFLLPDGREGYGGEVLFGWSCGFPFSLILGADNFVTWREGGRGAEGGCFSGP